MKIGLVVSGKITDNFTIKVNTKRANLLSLEDIKDGLVKMILFTNLKELEFENKKYSPVAILKLTSDKEFSKELLKESQVEQLRLLRKEAKKIVLQC